jgi:hypothetical protein
MDAGDIPNPAKKLSLQPKRNVVFTHPGPRVGAFLRVKLPLTRKKAQTLD